MNNKKNIISAIVYQIVLITYGFVVPRLILGTFGSDLNGLVASITQFLGFISLLEGGLGAVVLSELYIPIEENDRERIKNILCSSQKIFSRLTIVFIIYTFILACIFSLCFRTNYSISFISTLVIILSLTTVSQYLFAITLKLYLQANQKIYITNCQYAITYIFNIFVVVVTIRLCPEIRLLKLLSCVPFFLQPIVYRCYVQKDIREFKKNKKSSVKLKNRWSGFAQNLASYVNLNTDIILITMFCSLKDVSVYSIYMLFINAIRSIITYIINSYQSVLGRYIACGDRIVLQRKFKAFLIITWSCSIIAFSTCLLIINSFVKIYTNNVSDADYYQPGFAVIIILANMFYCMREPFRLLVLAGGRFKETNNGSIIEAALNLGVSLVLIVPLGLVGVAIGTLIGIVYRMVYLVLYVKREMLNFKLTEYRRSIISGFLLIFANIIVYCLFPHDVSSFQQVICYGIIAIVVEMIFVAIMLVGINKIKYTLNEFWE